MSDGMVKLRLSNADGDIETLWASPLGNHLYRLENSPGYAYRVSRQDVVEARAPSPGDVPQLVRVVQKSGHRTIRIILKPPSNESAESQAVLDRLSELGCSYEGANRSYIAVDLPPSVDLQEIRGFLIATGQQWEHADPTYEDLFSE